MNSPVPWIGAALVVVGVLFFFQGIGVVGGSVMSGVALWAILGPIIAILGAGLVWRGVRTR